MLLSAFVTPQFRLAACYIRNWGAVLVYWLVMRNSSVIALGAVAGAVLALCAVQPRLTLSSSIAKGGSERVNTYRQLNLFGDVFERIRADYVDKPNDEKLVEDAISGMLAGLDPHSSYMNAKSFKDMQVETRGEFGGVGMEVIMENGLLKVVSAIDGTPAAEAGVRADDVIVKIDGDTVQGLSLEQAVTKLRGPIGNVVNLTIDRKGKQSPLEVSLTRRVIRMPSAQWHVEGSDVGYVRLRVH